MIEKENGNQSDVCWGNDDHAFIVPGDHISYPFAHHLGIKNPNENCVGFIIHVNDNHSLVVASSAHCWERERGGRRMAKYVPSIHIDD